MKTKMTKTRLYNLIKDKMEELNIKELPKCKECEYKFYRGTYWFKFGYSYNNQKSYDNCRIFLTRVWGETYLINEIETEYVNEFYDHIYTKDRKVLSFDF